MAKIIPCICLCLFLTGCASHIQRQGYSIKSLKAPLSAKVKYTYQVPVKLKVDLAGHDHEVLGEVTIGDSGFSVKCGEDYVLALVENEALAVGANLINITWEQYPSIISSCYRLKAQLILVKDKEWAVTLKTDPQYRVGIYQE
jgi:hypothetical protein